MTKYLTMQKNHTVVILTLLAIVFVFVTGFAWSSKTVTVVADGHNYTVKTHLNSTGGVLHDAGIKLGAHDVVVLNTKGLQNGSVLTVLRAMPVTVIVDGHEKSVMTVHRKAQEVADELGYEAPNFVVLGDAKAKLTANSSIKIASAASHKTVTVEQVVPVQVVREKDDRLPLGYEESKQVGSAGAKQVTEEIFYDKSGKEIQRTVVKEAIVKDMVPTIIRVGSRDTVETSRGAMRYRKVISMNATAYTVEDGNGDGITASGRVAERGCVAVDPNVIPLGTRLYIPGYGMAVAADTGGAIKGNRIDLLMDSYGEAMEFGRRQIDVYVLD